MMPTFGAVFNVISRNRPSAPEDRALVIKLRPPAAARWFHSIATRPHRPPQAVPGQACNDPQSRSSSPSAAESSALLESPPR